MTGIDAFNQMNINSNNNTRVSGGDRALDHEFPWIVKLYSEIGYCSGTIYSTRLRV